jgi:hypothetical protein
MTRTLALAVLVCLSGSRPGAQTIPATKEPAQAAVLFERESDPGHRTPPPMVAPVEGGAGRGDLRTPLSVKGVASWYCCTAHYGDGLYAAAGRALRAFLGPKWRGMRVRVCAASCIVVRLVDWMANPKALIDLEPAAFRLLAPLSRGLITVRVTG